MIPSEFIMLFEATLRALIAAFAVWAGLGLLRVKNVPVQKAAWGLMLVAALAMPLLMRWQLIPAWAVSLPITPLKMMPVQAPVSVSAPVVSISFPGKPEAITQSRVGGREDFPAPADPIRKGNRVRSARQIHSAQVNKIESAAISPSAVQSPAARPAPQRTLQSATWSDAGPVLATAWIVYLGVCAVLLFRLVWGLASSFRIWWDAKPVATPGNLDLPGSIPVRWSERIGSPVNIGSGILLPADYAEWDEEKLRVVLAHERSHISQRDFYLQMIAGLYASLTWFSPLGWWLKRKLSELGEAISDHAGLDAASSPSAYAQLLLEFAAQPRPTLVTGVAMAHSKNLSNRIERLLNDSTFRAAFSGGRRALLALVVPVALIAATAMVRVEAAQAPQSATAAQPSMQSSDQVSAAPEEQSPATGKSRTGQSNVTQAAVLFSSQSPDQAPAPPQSVPAPAPVAEPSPDAVPAIPPTPPLPPAESQDAVQIVVPPIPPIDVHVNVPPIPTMAFMKGYEGHGLCWSNDGDTYAIVGDPGSKTRFCGNSGGEMEAEVEKARSAAHGHFLLFRHEGKYYIVDDPATVSQIEDMNKAMQDQGDKMRALGEQYRDAGKDVREQARKERETAENIPAPDLSKEMAELNATVASLTAKQGAVVPREEVQQVQREISAIQRRLIESEVKVNVNIDMSKFNVEMGQFNQQMSKMGGEMGRIAGENQDKISSIIDQSMKDGKARPVN